MTNRKVFDMRHITLLVVLTALAITSASAQQLRFVRPGYTIGISGMASSEGKNMPLVLGRLDTLTRQDANKRFGILYRGLGSEALSFKALELTDASTGRSLLTLSAQEVVGTFGPNDQRIADRSFSNDSMKVDAYRIERGGASYVLVQTRKRVRSSSMPGGSTLVIAWLVETSSAVTVRPVFRGVVEGNARAEGTALVVEPDSVASGYAPAVVISSGASSTVTVSQTPLSPTRTATFEGRAVALQANALSTVLSLNVTSTTVAVPQYLREQASILAAHLSGTAAAPRMITMTTVDTPEAQSGDTLQFRIMFHNIGTAPAVDIVLTNPISDGLRYITGSATADGSEITYENSTPEPPQAPVVQGITWTFTSNILPGEERWVSFKTIVQ